MSCDDYSEKYAPLLRLLDSDEDGSFLAGLAGYNADIGRLFNGARRESLRSYMLDMTNDFARLFRAASPLAAKDDALARELVEAKRSLDTAVRFLRFRLLLDSVFPAQVKPNLTTLIRRCLVRSPRILHVPQSWISGMDRLARQLPRTAY